LIGAGEADWKALGDEATALLSQYLRINTTNPPGNEIAAARWLAEGPAARRHRSADLRPPAPGKANLYARLAGDGSRAAPEFSSTTWDVVLASPEYWTVQPFSGLLKDGYVWGRGALDMKGEGIAQLMTMLILKTRPCSAQTRQSFFSRRPDERSARASAAAGSWSIRPTSSGRRVPAHEGGLTPRRRARRRGVLRHRHDREVAVLARRHGARDGRPRLASDSRQSRAPPDPRAEPHRRVADAAHGEPAAERSFRDLATIERDSTLRRG